MTSPYIRSAAKHPHIREQALERASKRPEWAGRPGKPDKPLNAFAAAIP